MLKFCNRPLPAQQPANADIFVLGDVGVWVFWIQVSLLYQTKTSLLALFTQSTLNLNWTDRQKKWLVSCLLSWHYQIHANAHLCYVLDIKFSYQNQLYNVMKKWNSAIGEDPRGF